MVHCLYSVYSVFVFETLGVFRDLSDLLHLCEIDLLVLTRTRGKDHLHPGWVNGAVGLQGITSERDWYGLSGVWIFYCEVGNWRGHVSERSLLLFLLLLLDFGWHHLATIDDSSVEGNGDLRGRDEAVTVSMVRRLRNNRERGLHIVVA